MICCAVEHMVNQRYDNEKGLWNLRRRAKANESDFLPRYFLKHRSKVFYFSLYLLFFLCRILFINGIFLKIEKSIRKVKGLSRAIINGVSSYEREQHSVSMYTIWRGRADGWLLYPKIHPWLYKGRKMILKESILFLSSLSKNEWANARPAYIFPPRLLAKLLQQRYTLRWLSSHQTRKVNLIRQDSFYLQLTCFWETHTGFSSFGFSSIPTLRNSSTVGFGRDWSASLGGWWGCHQSIYQRNIWDRQSVAVFERKDEG